MKRMVKEHFSLGFSLFFLLISSFTVLSVCNDQGVIDLELSQSVDSYLVFSVLFLSTKGEKSI